mgnify:CR=1 FL=1
MARNLNQNLLKSIVALLGGVFFIYVGVLHFIDTAWFEPIVPPLFGSATFWVLVSGVAEVAVGIGLIMPNTRKKAGYASALLLIAVYPANLYMWVYNIELGDGSSLSQAGHVVRLLLQISGILVSLWIADWAVKTRIRNL